MSKRQDANPFATEASSERDRLRLIDLVGELVIVEATGEAREIATTYGDKEAVPARVLHVGNDADGWMETLVFNGVIVRRLKDAAGKPVAGRLEQVPTKKGNPALVIKDAEPGSKDHEAAAAAWRKHEVPF